MKNPDPEKVAERRMKLEEQLEEVNYCLTMLLNGNNPHADQDKDIEHYKCKRKLLIYELEAMEPKPCPPSQTETLKAEVERLEAEVKRLTDGLRTVERRSHVPGRDTAEHLRQVARSFLDGNNTGTHALELEAENDRLKGEVERLRNAVQLGLHPALLEVKP